MPVLVVIEKLQPCLLDRLTDDDPKNSQESRTQRVISQERYRSGVLRDLQWLLSASAHLSREGDSSVSIDDYPEARRSVINFGTRHLYGLTLPNLRKLERDLVEALCTFEPRILRDTLKVQSHSDGHIINLVVDGDLWALPMPEHLQIKTSLDLENGQCTLGD